MEDFHFRFHTEAFFFKERFGRTFEKFIEGD
jgi:hypothetical protein